MTGKRLRKLTDLEITEVSLVTSAANEGARVMFWKSEHEARKLWDEFVDEFLSVHNKKLTERKANPPKNLSSDQVEVLRQTKPWSRDQAAQEARKTQEGSSLWQQVVAEAQPPLSKGNHMYKSLGEIANGIEKGEIKSQEDAMKVFDKFVEGEVKKSDYQMDVNQARLMKMTGPGWDSYYNAFMRLPETVEAGQAIKKRAKQSELIVKTIKVMAEKLVQKEGMTKEKAFIAILDRNPLLEATYREFY